jgi:hypothetical protein
MTERLGPQEFVMRVLALFAAHHVLFAGTHPLADWLIQDATDAQLKRVDRGWRGAYHCARHVVTYSATHGFTTYTAFRLLGYRCRPAPLLAALLINGLTHYLVDRGWLFQHVLVWTNSTAYAAHATVQRRPGVIDAHGPGTANTEDDQALHHFIGLFASLTFAALAARDITAR